MKALLVGEGWPPDRPGGLNRYYRALFEHLPGADVTARGVVVGPAADAPPTLRIAAPGGLPARVGAMTAAISRAARQADVLDVQFAMYGAVPLRLPHVAATPLVVHFHGPWSAESLAGGETSRSVQAKRAIETSVYRRADRLIVLSDAFAETLAGFGVSPDRIRKVRPGVDLARFTPRSEQERAAEKARLGLSPGDPLVIAVRRLVPRMGLDLLLRAWARRTDGVSGALLAIVGEGSEREPLEALAAQLGITASVRFLGKIDEARLTAVYGAADLAVTPSVSLEGFGLVLLESLAAGTPVLASDVGGMREAVGALGDEHLLPAGDEDAWATGLSDVLSGRRVLIERREARAFAEANSWSATAQSVRDVYAEAIAARRADGPPRG